MDRRILAEPRARQAIAVPDSGLRAELVERVAELSEAPWSYLHRPPGTSHPFAGYLFTYRSLLDPALEVECWIDARDDALHIVWLRPVAHEGP